MVRGRSVLPAIDLDRNASTMFGEIENVRAKWNLAPEVVARLVELLKPPPQPHFGSR
jgi:hypothetical protein